MAKLFQQIRVGTLTDDAVRAKTGKDWDEWCKILDRAGARMMDHQEIARWLDREIGLTHWWSQMIAVGYENQRGIRQDHRGEPPARRYEVTLNKLVGAPREAVWAAWQDRGALARWLPAAEFEVSKKVPPKILHLDWLDQTRVVVRFYERREKTRLVLAHGKLSESEAARLHRYWSDALERLKILMAR
jgi:hypothetical protein